MLKKLPGTNVLPNWDPVCDPQERLRLRRDAFPSWCFTASFFLFAIVGRCTILRGYGGGLMPATKSKGIGTIFLVLLLLVGVAGASAFFIHKILAGEDILPVSITQPDGSGAAEKISTAGASSKTPSQELSSGPVASTAPVPLGQLVVPPATLPPPPVPLPGDEPSRPAQIPTQIPTTVYIAPSPISKGGQRTFNGEVSDEPGPPLLLVPGAMETPPPAVREDAVVRPAFVDDIAAFLVQNYWPKNSHPSARRSGITTASLQWANLRYGAELRGLESGIDPGTVRRAILGYILNSAAVGRIYNLYADGFVAALRQGVDKRSVGEDNAKRLLTVQEKREMFGIYAGYASSVAAALENYAADSAMPGRVRALTQAENAVQDANRVYLESMLSHEEAVASGDRAHTTAAQLRMDKEAATYQKRVREREAAKDALVAAMSKGRNWRDTDMFVYAAFWAYRRGEGNSQPLRACAKALSDISAKLTAVGKQIQ